jgi:dihydroorotate dehydrogenase electron transfer subunit
VVRWDDMGTIPFDALGAPGWKPAPERPRGSTANAESRHAG